MSIYAPGIYAAGIYEAGEAAPEAVGADQAGAYTIHQPVGADAAGAYALAQLAGASQPGAYALWQSVGASQAGGYTVEGDPSIVNWPTGPSASEAAVVPAEFGMAIVQPLEPATVPRANLRALVPIHGDDMQPIKTFEIYTADREIYELDFDRLYLSTARDTAATLQAITAPAGLSVTPEVTVGGALASGVVRFAVEPTAGPGSYDVAARISTAAGRRKTGVVTIVVEP